VKREKLKPKIGRFLINISGTFIYLLLKILFLIINILSEMWSWESASLIIYKGTKSFGIRHQGG